MSRTLKFSTRALQAQSRGLHCAEYWSVKLGIDASVIRKRARFREAHHHLTKGYLWKLEPYYSRLDLVMAEFPSYDTQVRYNINR